MSVPNPGDPLRNAIWPPHRTAVLLVGALVLAVSLIGIWWSQHPTADAPMPDARTAAPLPRAFTFSAHASPRSVADIAFENGSGQKLNLSAFRGKVVLLNLWATWCGPCRAEMPTLDRLQSKLGSNHFEVVALSIDRGGQAVVKGFYDEINVRALAIYVDATMEAQASLGIIGVPTTLLIDREGREVARYTGPAEWDRAEVIDTIRRYLPPSKL